MTPLQIWKGGGRRYCFGDEERSSHGTMAKKKKDSVEEPIEKQNWKATYKPRKNIDITEYRHSVLGPDSQ